MGFVTALNLRILGIANGIPLGPIDTFFRFVWFGFWINALSGTLLFLIDPTRSSRKVDVLGPGDDAPLSAKLIAALSLCFRFGVLYAGRMLPYIGNSF